MSAAASVISRRLKFNPHIISSNESHCCCCVPHCTVGDIATCWKQSPFQQVSSASQVDDLAMTHQDTDNDNMTCIVQGIARQALITFRNQCPAAAFPDNQIKLKSLMAEVRAADLKLTRREGDGSEAGAPPVTYMHICKTDDFSMGVFLLRRGASIPLHDHPGMHGMLRVMYGAVRITCFDKMEKTHPSAAAAAAAAACTTDPPATRGSLQCAQLRSIGEFTEDSGPCVLGPDTNNLHQIDAVDGPAAFLDVLAPPYDPDDGRDCHYYKALLIQSEARDPQEVWLMEISQPRDFWCGTEHYPGPQVTL